MNLRDKLAAKNAAIAAASDENRASTRPTDGGPKTAPGRLLEAMPMLAAKDKLVADLELQIGKLRQELQVASDAGAELGLDALVEIPGRRRKMTAEKYAELRENLRHNKLIHPVVVRKTADGRFEIVSGHHRVDAFREIGREVIRCVVIEGSDDEVTDGAFNANLMQSGLTDYEKYLGFKIRIERTPGLTQAAIADQFGVTPAMVSYIFAFDQLPLDALSVIEGQPDIIGSTAVAALAGIAKQGKTTQVTDAVRRLAAGEIDQSQAVKLAGQDATKPKKEAASPASDKIKQGKTTYCEMRRAKNVVRLEFKSEAEAERLHAAIRAFLENQSKNPSESV